jgi:1-aminocyclopropane-1-carboxylate deaminase
VAEELRAAGRSPGIIPAGASDHPAGGLGYALCAYEISEQARRANVRFDYVVHATSSGSTQAGLVAGFRTMAERPAVFGIEVDAMPHEVKATVTRIARRTLERLNQCSDEIEDDVHVIEGYAGPAYGLPDDAALDAIRLTARLEAILLDPVYEGKAMAGLIDLVKGGQFSKSDKILFIHLGGTPSLHAYHSAFSATSVVE